MGARKIWLWIGLPVLVLSTVGAVYSVFSREHGPTSAEAISAPSPRAAVSCLGRIEPKDGVIRVAAPYFESRPALVRTVIVKEGDSVKAGQALVVLDGSAKLKAAAAYADAQVAVARRRLEQVKAGAKPDDVAAQQSEVSREEAEFEYARAEYQRYQRLYETHDVSAADVDEKRTRMETLSRDLESSEARLRSLSAVPAADVALAESELSAAIAQANAARTSLESSIVRAPRDGQVLKIRTHAGEEVGPEGILDLGRTDHMYVVAEVYETDIRRVRVGDSASISSDLFPGKLQGRVEIIEPEISKGEVLPNDPVAFADERVFHVKILLTDNGEVKGLINGKVSVLIQP